jgi:hypothetical protein
MASMIAYTPSDDRIFAMKSRIIFLFLCALLAGLLPIHNAAHSRSLFENIKRETGRCFHGGCDVAWHLNKRFDDGLRSKAESLVGPAKAAFIEASDHLFNKHVGPTIDRVDAILGTLGARLDQTRDIVHDIEHGIDALLDKAQEVAKSTLGDVQAIVNTTFDRADELLRKAVQQAQELIRHLACLRDGTAQVARAAMSDLARAFSPLPTFMITALNQCYSQHGHMFLYDYLTRPPASDDFIRIFYIKECQIREEMGRHSEVDQIVRSYIELEELARRTTCAMEGNVLAQSELAQRVSYYRERAAIWQLARGTFQGR